MNGAQPARTETASKASYTAPDPRVLGAAAPPPARSGCAASFQELAATDFGKHLAGDGDRIIVAEEESIWEYVWDGASSSWIVGRTVLDLSDSVEGVATSAGRVAYLRGANVEVLGPPDHSVALVHLPNSIAMVGSTVAVGYSTARTVEVYNVAMDASPPSLIDTIMIPTGDNDWDFGSSLAFSDDTQYLAVGAPESNSAFTGRVYVYQKLVVRGEGAAAVTLIYNHWHTYEHVELHNDFGRSVALNQDGSLLVVGAPLEDTSGGTLNVGGVFMYDNTSFALLDVVGGGGEGYRLGTSVDVRGRTVLSAETGFDLIVPGFTHLDRGVGNVDSGRGVLLEEDTPSHWTAVAFFGGPDGEEFQYMGERVALAGSKALFAAPFRSFDAGNPDRGAVYSYALPSIFTDGFEIGDTSAWSASVP